MVFKLVNKYYWNNNNKTPTLGVHSLGPKFYCSCTMWLLQKGHQALYIIKFFYFLLIEKSKFKTFKRNIYGRIATEDINQYIYELFKISS